MSNIKIFEDKKIRTEWDSEKEDWLFSVADVCNILADSQAKDRNAYWRNLKLRLKKEGSQVVSNCYELKLIAEDGKKYKTDVMYTKDILRIVQSIPSPKAEPFKMWLAQVGSERVDEIADPEKAMQRGVDFYRQKGYPAEWITQRMLSIKIRKELTDEWKNRGIEKVLIICKKSIKKQWIDEIHKFTDIGQSFKMYRTGSTAAQRKKAYDDFNKAQKGILVTNYHSFLNDTPLFQNMKTL